MKKLFSKANLTAYAGLGLGSVAATLVESKVVPSALPEKLKADSPDLETIVGGLAPVVAGVFTPTIVKGAFGQSLGDGMIAAGAATLTRYAIKKVSPETATQLGIEGDVMMSGADEMPMTSGTLMGSAGVDDYSSSAYDFTAADAGEMNF